MFFSKKRKLIERETTIYAGPCLKYFTEEKINR